jgi:hypothetical protein
MRELSIKGLKMTTKRLTRLSILTGFLCLMLFTLPALCQNMPGLDENTPNKLGEAAKASSASAYVLGFISFLSLSFAAWTVNKRDETINEIKKLSTSIDVQTDVLKSGHKDAIESARIAAVAANKAAEVAMTAAEVSRLALNDKEDHIQQLLEQVRLMTKRPCALDSETMQDFLKGRFSGH